LFKVRRPGRSSFEVFSKSESEDSDELPCRSGSAENLPADIELAKVRDLLNCDLAAFLKKQYVGESVMACDRIGGGYRLLSGNNQDKAIYINVEQVRALQWSQNTGPTTIVFSMMNGHGDS
jgi:hypothetical protein